MLMQLAANRQHRSLLQKSTLLVLNKSLSPLHRIIRCRRLSGSTATDAARKAAIMAPDQILHDMQTGGVTSEKTVKKKMALHIAYVGTAFRGLQAQPNLADLGSGDTVEDALAAAMAKTGHISPSNAIDLKKVSWSRSSRTDKGVHALAGVVALKMEMKGDHDYEADPEGLACAWAINEHLPETVRVLAAQRVNRSFDAKMYCGERTYHYWLPASAIGMQNDGSDEDARRLQLLRQCLALYEGSHPFHNYTKRRLYRAEYRERGGNRRGTRAEQDVAVTTNARNTAEGAFPQPIPDEGAPSASQSSPAFASAEQLKQHQQKGQTASDGHGDTCRNPVSTEGLMRGPTNHVTKRVQTLGWNAEIKEGDKIEMAHYRYIRECTASEAPSCLVAGHPPAIRVVIRGDSFMLHQIRHMVGAAAAVALDIIPIDVIRGSLTTPSRAALPLAPGAPLLLATNLFNKFPSDTCNSAEEGAPPPPGTVMALSGPCLSLRQGGAAIRDSFHTNVLLPHISALLQNEEWDQWDDTMKGLLWDSEDLSNFLTAAAAWTANRPVSKDKQPSS